MVAVTKGFSYRADSEISFSPLHTTKIFTRSYSILVQTHEITSTYYSEMIFCDDVPIWRSCAVLYARRFGVVLIELKEA